MCLLVRASRRRVDGTWRLRGDRPAKRNADRTVRAIEGTPPPRRTDDDVALSGAADRRASRLRGRHGASRPSRARRAAAAPRSSSVSVAWPWPRVARSAVGTAPQMRHSSPLRTEMRLRERQLGGRLAREELAVGADLVRCGSTLHRGRASFQQYVALAPCACRARRRGAAQAEARANPAQARARDEVTLVVARAAERPTRAEVHRLRRGMRVGIAHGRTR